MNKNQKYLRSAFAAGVIFLGIFLFAKMCPPFWLSKHISMKITQMPQNIQTVNEPRDGGEVKEYFINNINFPEGSSFTHRNYGNFHYTERFFADFSVNFKVNKEGYYNFRITSDDGFRLLIDGAEVGIYLADRSFSASNLRTYLTKGQHSLALNYFQGYGPLGLTAEYKCESDNRWRFIGDDSKYLMFQK